jgi:hypothetical protein
MKLKRYNTEIIIETITEAEKSGRSVGSSNEFPIVFSYPYGKGLSPIHLTLNEACELLEEMKSAIERLAV